MALSKTSLKSKIITELKAKGFVTEGEHAQNSALAEAIANAVVEEILSNAEVMVPSGSSAGQWPIK